MPSSSAAPADFRTAARFSPALAAASNWTIRAVSRRRMPADSAARLIHVDGRGPVTTARPPGSATPTPRERSGSASQQYVEKP